MDNRDLLTSEEASKALIAAPRRSLVSEEWKIGGYDWVLDGKGQ